MNPEKTSRLKSADLLVFDNKFTNVVIAVTASILSRELIEGIPLFHRKALAEFDAVNLRFTSIQTANFIQICTGELGMFRVREKEYDIWVKT